MKTITNRNSLNPKTITLQRVIDGYLIADRPEAATVKESLTVQNRARLTNAEEITELARIEKQLEQKKALIIVPAIPPGELAGVAGAWSPKATPLDRPPKAAVKRRCLFTPAQRTLAGLMTKAQKKGKR